MGWSESVLVWGVGFVSRASLSSPKSFRLVLLQFYTHAKGSEGKRAKTIAPSHTEGPGC